MPRNNPSVIVCAEELRLSYGVAKAVQENYAAKSAYDQAVRNRSSLDTSAATIIRARKAESAAVAALNEHRKEHGC